jgi:SulP family sulfate permease
MGEWHEFVRLKHFSNHYRLLMLGTFFLTVVFDLTVAVEVGLGLACVLFVRRMSALFRAEPELPRATTATAPAADQGELAPGACRTWSVESENRTQRGQFSPDLQPHSGAMGQKDGEKWTAAADLQPTISTSDRLLAAGPRPRLAWRLHGALFFGAAAKIDPIVQAVEAGPEGPEVVLNARDLFALDTTGLEGLEQILKAVGQRGGVLCVQDAQEQPRSLMERSGFNARLAAQNAVQHRKSS